jgi:hypothetical protein
MTTREEFWQAAAATRRETEAVVAPAFATLATAPPERLRAILGQYRFYTQSYASDLALFVHKLPPGRLRSVTARILSEEMGYGDPRQDHLGLYDRFLCSLGWDRAALDQSALPANVALLDRLRELLLARSPAFGVGLRGMGGECLCVVYLLLLHDQLRRNPFVKSNAQAIDWVFWDIHTGEIDEEHGVITRAAVDEYMAQRPAEVDDLHEGYRTADSIWRRFWQNVFADEGLVTAAAA